jgi:hypothetical protein
MRPASRMCGQRISTCIACKAACGCSSAHILKHALSDNTAAWPMHAYGDHAAPCTKLTSKPHLLWCPLPRPAHAAGLGSSGPTPTYSGHNISGARGSGPGARLDAVEFGSTVSTACGSMVSGGGSFTGGGRQGLSGFGARAVVIGTGAVIRAACARRGAPMLPTFLRPRWRGQSRVYRA